MQDNDKTNCGKELRDNYGDRRLISRANNLASELPLVDQQIKLLTTAFSHHFPQYKLANTTAPCYRIGCLWILMYRLRCATSYISRALPLRNSLTRFAQYTTQNRSNRI